MMAGKKKAPVTAPARWEDVPEIPRAEQPCPLPEGWKWVRLGELTTIESGGTPATKNEEYYSNGDIPWICPSDLSDFRDVYISHGKRNISKKGLKNSSAKILPIDSVCLTTRAPVGYVCIAANELSTNQGFKNFLPSPLYFPRYLYWYFKGNKSFLETYASGTTFKEISGQRAKQILFPLPALETQQRIVSRIESLFSQLDEAAEKVQAVIDSHEARKQAILHRAFRGELTRDREVDEEDSSTDIPELPGEQQPYPLPKGWKWVKLSSVAKWGSGGTPSRKHSEYYAGEIAWLKTGELTDSEISATEEHITTEALNNSSARLFPINTVIMAMYGATIGKLGILKIKAATNQACACAQCHDFIHYKYLFFYLLSQRDEFIKLGKGGAQPNISQEIIKNFLIPLPPLAIQEYIVSRIESLFSKLEPVFESGQETLEKISQLRKSVLHSAFRGKLT